MKIVILNVVHDEELKHQESFGMADSNSWLSAIQRLATVHGGRPLNGRLRELKDEIENAAPRIPGRQPGEEIRIGEFGNVTMTARVHYLRLDRHIGRREAVAV